MHAVEVTHLSKWFGGKKALDDVTLRIPRGKVFGLLGPNGAGKTTLITILAGLTTADAGEAKVLGLDVRRDVHAVRVRIGLMRGFSGAPHGMKAPELLEYYMRLYDRWNPKRARQLLESVKLWGEPGYVSDFSSGMRQRFFFAKALCNDPDLLFLDEPTVGLDVDAALLLRRRISELRETGKTVLLTTHHLIEAEQLCDEIALINHGRIVAQGTPAELRRLVKEKEVVRVASPDADGVARELRRVRGVWGVYRRKTFVEAVVSDPRVLKRILERLAHSKYLPVTRIELVEPPLEEAFLKLVGKS
jgi:ABC-2 type transport system ATP-binding protein